MCSNKMLFSILVITQIFCYANAANILYLNGVSSPSHHIWHSAFVNKLAAHGHNVTFITPDMEKNPQPNVHYIYMNELYNKEYFKLIQVAFEGRKISPIMQPRYFTEYMFYMCKEIIKTNGFHTLKNYPDDFRFDLIINDMSQGSCLIGFMHKFNYPPLMSVTPFSHPPYLNALIGGHHYYSYVPHYMLPYHDEMTFFQRFYNFILHVVEVFNWETVLDKKLDQVMKDAYGSDLPTVSELEKRIAIALVSTTPVFDPPQPLPPNVIDVGGMHIRDPKPLPKNLEKIILSSKKGAVLFALGSNFRSSAMSIEKQKILLEAFEQFPDYHFIWKFEKPMVDLKLPKNVFIESWLPQSDILNHPKTKAFITHSGSLSTLESIWRGVPMIGIPFGFDQKGNVLKSIKKGIAEQLDYQTLTTELAVEKLQKVLEDPKYTENAKQLSTNFRDQKETPVERAVWYAEWLIRNPNRDYLKSPILRLGLIAGNSYDVIGIISILLFIIASTVVKFLWRIFKLFFFESEFVVVENNKKEN